VAIFVSKYDHCLYDLLLRHRAGELACEIPLSSATTRTSRRSPSSSGSLRGVPDPARHQGGPRSASGTCSTTHGIDLIVLARYMQVLSPAFTDAYPARIINIHHSFLPAFMGGKPYHQAHQRGVKLIGATAHYATPDLDEGPIIEQDVSAPRTATRSRT
jgi:formyltetrahydrofolate deformylase